VSAWSEDASRDAGNQARIDQRIAEFVAFYQNAAKEIVGYALRMGLRPGQAEEVAQTVWMKFFEIGPDLAEKTAAQCHAWLFQVARNEMMNLFRELRRRPKQWPDYPDREPLPYRQADPASRELLFQWSELFRRWLEELRHRHPLRYELVFARHIEGERPADLAKKHGKSTHWISVQINRALTDFRAWLAKHRVGDEEDHD